MRVFEKLEENVKSKQSVRDVMDDEMTEVVFHPSLNEKPLRARCLSAPQSALHSDRYATFCQMSSQITFTFDSINKKEKSFYIFHFHFTLF